MSDIVTVGKILAKASDVGFNPNPTDTLEINTKMSGMNNASTIDDIKVAVSDVVNAIQKSFESFINDQRTLHEQSILTVADAQISTTQSNNAQTSEIVNSVRAVTAPISEDARKARQALSDGILGRISDKVTSFTSSLKPILPSLQTFGIAFATTGLGAMFMTNALISAIKFIFNNPLMFIGSLIGGSILYNMFKEPINNFITKISDKLKGWLSDILGTALTKTVKDSAKTIEGLIDKFSSLNLSSDGLFKNINGSIEKLQKAIDESWGKINKDIDATIENIFKMHFPNAIKEFFTIFNAEIPKSIVAIDKALSESNEFQKIINTADGVSTALNNVCTLYNNNKEQIDKLINAFDGNKSLLSALTSFIAPKKVETNITKLDDADMSTIAVETKDDKGGSIITNSKNTTTGSTTSIVTSTAAKPTTDKNPTLVTNVFQKIITNAVAAANGTFNKDTSADLKRLKTVVETAVENVVAPVKSVVTNIGKRIDDEDAEIKKILRNNGDLSKTFKDFASYLKSVMNKKTSETTPTVVVNTLTNGITTEQRKSDSSDGL